MNLQEKETVLKLIQGQTVVITDNNKLIRVKEDLKEIKQNVNIVLKQINETLKLKK